VVDRFLEHSRVLYFGIEDREDVFITSTDIMPRNFDRRIEVMLPIEDEALRRRIVDEVLGVELQDESKAAMLMPDGSYRRILEPDGLRAQREFIRRARQRARQDDRRRRRAPGEA
jgi:polyphosphate kinase